MSAATEEVQSLDQSADVFVYEISNFNSKNRREVIRLSNFASVSFNGPTIGLAISHDSQETTSTGSQPRMTISVSDTNGVVTSLIDSIDGLEGATVKIYRTKRRFLDDGSTPNTVQGILQQATLVISRVADFVPMSIVTVECQSPIDYGNISTPSRTATQKCSWAYRSSECGYVGTAMFDLAGNPVISSESDICGKDLKACRARANVINFGGFPGLRRR